MKSFLKVAVAGLVVLASSGTVQAGDWRELVRANGAVVAMDASTMRRNGTQLSIDLLFAFMPERLMPFYGLVQADIDCEAMTVAVGGAQFYLSNGDPFGDRTDGLADGAFVGDDDVEAFCDGIPPEGPGTDSALAFFRAVNGGETAVSD